MKMRAVRRRKFRRSQARWSAAGVAIRAFNSYLNAYREAMVEFSQCIFDDWLATAMHSDFQHSLATTPSILFGERDAGVSS